MFIDTHCHLDAAEFTPDRDSVAAAARAAGVGWQVIPAIGRVNFATVRELAARTPGAVYALGIHPLFAADAGPDDLDALREQVGAALADPLFVGIGEIGLDLFDERAKAAWETQLEVFRGQLRIAAEFGLPVLMHIRRAQDPVLRELRRVPVPAGIAHAFNGSLQQAAEFVKLGMRLGMGGELTFERALRIRRIATEMPLDSLVLETDAPDIAPSWIRPGRNVPAATARIGAVLAGLRGIGVDEIAAATTANARAVLPRLAAVMDAADAATATPDMASARRVDAPADRAGPDALAGPDGVAAR
ncbi:TatD family hydrolase [Derxia gummosa]|uniref:TatD family hydrolase n=1 Tax=Derxia gummosa DSM 723 TaxID=1121388 RepID=A0AC36KJT3_9BURK|nr:TatD family hydrolase [Derxia gummosa]